MEEITHKDRDTNKHAAATCGARSPSVSHRESVGQPNLRSRSRSLEVTYLSESLRQVEATPTSTLGRWSVIQFSAYCVTKWWLICLCAGYIDDVCGVHVDSRPTILGLLDGDTCVVTDSEPCEEVDINAERFAINSMFSCRVVVSKQVWNKYC